MSHRYHYIDSGLDWVWLENGFERHATTHGPATSIDLADDLHRAIALEVARRPGALRGQEVRLLRAFLRMGADELGLLLAHAGAPAAVAAWEAERDEPIPAAAGVALRAFALGVLKGDGPADRITPGLGEGAALGDPALFHLGPFGWGLRHSSSGPG